MSEPQSPTIRFVLSDIDGTLLHPDHSLSQATIDAVAQLRRKGILFTVASSRPPRAMRQQIEALGVDLPTAGFNGANIVGADGQVLRAYRIPTDAARMAIELLKQFDVAVWVFADDQWFLLDPQGDYVEHERQTLGYDPVLVDDFEPMLGRVDKIVAASTDFELLKRLEAQLNPMIVGKALAARSQLYYLDVTAVDANKGKALMTLCEMLDVDMAHAAVIGDGGNDVAMFRHAGLSIAMGQAEANVRDQADVVTASNLEDGVAMAIERYILPR
jgi:Cof subfamily protein (haloacid dehalogenase superfamily)